jgi:hypothetical protein
VNLPVMEMPRAEARELFLSYKREVEERHDDELAEIMAGYRQMALGRPVLSMRQAIEQGGTVTVADQNYEHGYGWRTVERQRPALACLRADQPECWVTMSGVAKSATATFRHHNIAAWGTRNSPRRTVSVPGLSFPEARFPSSPFVAMTPIVPPQLRPKRHLRNYHILWEAKWTRDKPLAPEDPALLKRIGRDLFVVLAIWDLTPLERAVLGARG